MTPKQKHPEPVLRALTQNQRDVAERMRRGATARSVSRGFRMSDEGEVPPPGRRRFPTVSHDTLIRLHEAKIVRKEWRPWRPGHSHTVLHYVYAEPGEVDRLAEESRVARERSEVVQKRKANARMRRWVDAVFRATRSGVPPLDDKRREAVANLLRRFEVGADKPPKTRD